MAYTIRPDAPFSLSAAAEFTSLSGPQATPPVRSTQARSAQGRPAQSDSADDARPDDDRPDRDLPDDDRREDDRRDDDEAGGEMRLAFVMDDMTHDAAAYVTQDANGVVSASIDTDGNPHAAWRQLLRIFSLDRPAGDWPAVGAGDPVIGQLQEKYPGLRPVLLSSPYEAAAWSIISARRYTGKATAVWNQLSGELGRAFTVAGQDIRAFPLPHRLLKAESLPNVSPERLQWLHTLARAALDGAITPARLRGMDTEQALAYLQQLPGLGPTYATVVLMRAAGVADALPAGDPRLPGYVARFYGARTEPVPREELELIAEDWRPFRTWSAFLVRHAGSRLGGPAVTAA
jgi:DNA-3-methyladenine glycosylase II